MSHKNSRSIVRWTLTAITALVLAACAEEPERDYTPGWTTVAPRPEIYANFALTADLSGLSDNQREMIAILIEASEIMDDLFWRQAWADDWQTRLDAIEDDDAFIPTKAFVERGTQPSSEISRRLNPGRGFEDPSPACDAVVFGPRGPERDVYSAHRADACAQRDGVLDERRVELSRVLGAEHALQARLHQSLLGRAHEDRELS